MKPLPRFGERSRDMHWVLWRVEISLPRATAEQHLCPCNVDSPADVVYVPHGWHGRSMAGGINQ